MSQINPTDHSNNSSTETATLEWRRGGLPFSPEFDDFYFSPGNGLEESRYIFLQQNRLEQRWQALAESDTFVIGETGFGSGLNFLASWQLWLQTAPIGARLHFVSVEKHPLHCDDLRRALALWPEISSLAEQLLSSYPKCLHSGFHRLHFDTPNAGSVTLTLLIGDATDCLEQLQATDRLESSKPSRLIDAWFLDGFTPAKNPEMWSEKLFSLLSRLSHCDTTLATFAAASRVKKSLTDNNFKIKTLPGFAKKREMVSAVFIPDKTPKKKATEGAATPDKKPPQRKQKHKSLAWHVHTPPAVKQRTALIIGGGIAGSQSAYALAQRGWKVTLIEQHQTLANEASGNPQGVLYGKLSHRRETLSDFNLFTLQFAERFYTPFLTQDTNLGATCGVLQTSHSDKTDAQQRKLIDALGDQTLVEKLTQQQASLVAGVELSRGGLFFPGGGWLSPSKMCQTLTEHPNISLITGRHVDQLIHDNGTWSAINTGNKIASASLAIICNANAAKRLSQAQQLPIKPVRGQISYLNEDKSLGHLKTVLCGEGYIAPAHNHQHCLGATFDTKSQSLQTQVSDHLKNFEKIKGQYPQWLATLNPEEYANSSQGRTGLRCTTPDYLPLVGPAPKYERYTQDFEALRRNAKANISIEGDNWPGLYLNVGYGSRGIAYSPLCAELLASMIHGEPYPVSHQLQAALHPARFIIRDLMRNKI